MGWQETLKRGSFKGISFTVDEASLEFGRELEAAGTSGGTINLTSGGAETSASKKEKRPAVKDNGIALRTYYVTANFSGNDYQESRNAFIDAVEDGSPGMLVLPTFPTIQKAIGKIGTVVYSNQIGGKETVSVSFVDQGDAVSPSKAVDTKALIDEAVGTSLDSGYINFLRNYDVPQQEKSLDAVVDDLKKFTKTAAESTSSGIATTSENFDEAAENLNNINDNAELLATEPASLYDAYAATLDNIAASFTTVEAAFSAIIGIPEAYANKLLSTIGVGQQAFDRIKNQLAGLIAIHNSCLANAANLLSQIEFATLSDVASVRAIFGASMNQLRETLGETTGYEDVYRDLIKLNAAVFNDLVERSAALPIVQERTVETAFGGVKYAYNKYGNADRLDEIRLRNNVRRTLFLSGNLELLSK